MLSMYKLLEHIINEITLTEEGIMSFWVLPSGKILRVPNHRQHMDILLSNPTIFRVNKKFLDKAYKEYTGEVESEGSSSSFNIVKLALDEGCAAITYRKEEQELSILSKELTNTILDSAIEGAMGNISVILWENYKRTIEGTVEEMYNRV